VSVARLVICLCIAALAGCGSGKPSEPAKPREPTRPAPVAPTATTNQGSAAVQKPEPSLIPAGSGSLAAMARARGLTLRDKPHGRVIAHLLPRTFSGAPTVVFAEKRRGDWLGVVAAALPNGRLGWLDVRHDRPRMWRTPYSITASLSARTIVLHRGSKVVRTIPVTIGAPDTPTPIGEFAVTDKLIAPPGSVYGCCLLALSGHQPIVRPGWAGGARIAIHGSPSQLVGEAASAGCLRARNEDLRYLMKRIVLGTPVRIRA
jgi:hypothetical protein